MLWGRLLFIATILLPSTAAAQSGMGAFDFNGRPQNRPVTEHVLSHPSGSPVLNFTLPGGSCSADDCRFDRERAQLMQKDQDNRAGDSFRYTVSFFVPADFEDVAPANLMLWEVKPRGDGKPSAVVEIIGGRLQFTLSNPSVTQADKMNPERPIIIRDLGAIPRGRWTDMTLEVKWSQTEDGTLEVYRNGQSVVRHNGPNIDSNSTRQMVMFGLYRSFVSRYLQASGNAQAPLQQVFFANVTRQRL